VIEKANRAPRSGIVVLIKSASAPPGAREDAMRRMHWQWLALIAVLGMAFAVAAPGAAAQIAVQVGPPPACPYGYYDVPPYDCAPYGYYGPEWFANGVFIGVGPWFHGDEHWRGRVDYDHYGWDRYHGARPHPGDRADAGHRVDHMENFHGSQMRDGHGHVSAGHGDGRH